METITGVTFPVPKEYMSRFFEEGKTVFIKPATVYKEVKPGLKLVFYQSHEDTGYVGEATIENVELSEDPLSFFGTYGNAIFLTQEEVKAYFEIQEKWKSVRVKKGERKKKKWIALTLTDIKKYPEIQRPDRFLSVGGKYLKE